MGERKTKKGIIEVKNCIKEEIIENITQETKKGATNKNIKDEIKNE